MLRCLSFGFTPVLNQKRHDDGFSNGGKKWFTSDEHDHKRFKWPRPDPHVAILLELRVLHRIFNRDFLDSTDPASLKNPHYLLPFHSFCKKLPIMVDAENDAYYIPIQLCSDGMGKYLKANMNDETVRENLSAA